MTKFIWKRGFIGTDDPLLCRKNCRILFKVYGEHATIQATCERWFKRFKSDDFNVGDNQHPSRTSAFKDQQIQALLDEYARQTKKQLAMQLDVAQQTVSVRLKTMGKILKERI